MVDKWEEQDLFEQVLDRAFKDAVSKPRGQQRLVQTWATVTAVANRDQARAFLLGQAWDGEIKPPEGEELEEHLMPFTAEEAELHFTNVCDLAHKEPGVIRKQALKLERDGWEYGWNTIEEITSAGGEIVCAPDIISTE